MGGTTSTRRVTFEADENENITVVKGIRLSGNVIDRMKESSPSGSKSQRYSGAYGASPFPLRSPLSFTREESCFPFSFSYLLNFCS
uniref:Uncharacterized protein n=1 Tax=Pan paniscus TaxID=9597 RepID=A0A2R9AKH1_PANPA